MKTALLAASLVLVGGTAVACGGGGAGAGAPTDASKDDFCEAYSSLFTDMAAAGADSGGEAPDNKAMLSSIKKWAEKMEDVGTPEGISEDARSGFELVIKEVDGLEAKDFDEASLGNLGDELSKEEKKQTEEFTTYLDDTCGNPLEDMAPSEPAG